MEVDAGGTAAGRGAYVCGAPGCVKAAVSGRLARALRAPLGPDDLARLRKGMEKERT